MSNVQATSLIKDLQKVLKKHKAELYVRGYEGECLWVRIDGIKEDVLLSADTWTLTVKDCQEALKRIEEQTK
jgi:hypothetical protein